MSCEETGKASDLEELKATIASSSWMMPGISWRPCYEHEEEYAPTPGQLSSSLSESDPAEQTIFGKHWVARD